MGNFLPLWIASLCLMLGPGIVAGPDDRFASLEVTAGTDGDSVAWFRSANVIHMGDHLHE